LAVGRMIATPKHVAFMIYGRSHTEGNAVQ